MIKIDVVADIVCPWCFIGKRRLESALLMARRQRPEISAETRWLPFFLNPDTPPEGEPYLPFLVRKFGNRAAVDALFDRVRSAGKHYGIDYAFEKIALRANTLAAHRLLYWAQQQGSADTLMERLLVAQFQRGEAVGDLATLARIAGECGYPEAEVASYLQSDRDSAIVRNLERDTRELGINMVPTFIVGNERIIVGAENPTILADAILSYADAHR